MWFEFFCCCSKNSEDKDVKVSPEILKFRKELSADYNLGFALVKNKPKDFAALDAETKLIIARQLQQGKRISDLTDIKMQALITQLLNAAEPKFNEIRSRKCAITRNNA